jgi:hypothetical protein
MSGTGWAGVGSGNGSWILPVYRIALSYAWLKDHRSILQAVGYSGRDFVDLVRLVDGPDNV